MDLEIPRIIPQKPAQPKESPGKDLQTPYVALILRTRSIDVATLL